MRDTSPISNDRRVRHDEQGRKTEEARDKYEEDEENAATDAECDEKNAV